MGLRDYRKKRNFSTTPEPTGGTNAGEPIFVVQKHAASHLHYDFRLQHGDVLWSWAVPKGPSLVPQEKRLAVQVEDHPLDYADFEGTIPAGEYGGGTVLVWDRGVWQAEGDPSAGRETGRLKFALKGKKLTGRWTLVRMKSKPGERAGSKPQWLLIKERDSAARSLEKGDILEQQPRSVLSARTLEEIASDQPKRRGIKMSKSPRSTHRSAPARITKTAAARQRETKRPRRQMSRPASSVNGARRTAMPKGIEPQLATLVDKPPEGEDWLHELKFDGYRMLVHIDRGRVRFISRNGRDWTPRLKGLAPEMAELPAIQAILDGEVVVLDEQGVSNFQLLQNALGNGHSKARLVHYVFDLLYLNGFDLRGAALQDRKSVLESLVSTTTTHARVVRYSEHFAGSGTELADRACQAGAEGIVSKRADALYVPGRSTSWLKSKCRQGQEFVIGGFTDPGGARNAFGSLLLGYHRPDGTLAYAGRVGTGFSDQTLRDLQRRLAPLEIRNSPFGRLPAGSRSSDVHWVKPELVAQVKFSNWTKDGLLRQAAFEGLRDDKPATAVTREKASRPTAHRK